MSEKCKQNVIYAGGYKANSPNEFEQFQTVYKIFTPDIGFQAELPDPGPDPFFFRKTGYGFNSKKTISGSNLKKKDLDLTCQSYSSTFSLTLYKDIFFIH